jgi:hypothetical protein
VVDRLVVRAPDAERDAADDLVHDGRDLDVLCAQRGAHALDAAPDVEADAGRRDVLGVRDGTADRHRVPDVAVGAQGADRAVLGVDAAAQLVDRALVVVADDGQALIDHVLLLPGGGSGLTAAPAT